MVNLAGSLRFTVDSNANRLRNDLGRFMKGIPDMEEDMAQSFAEELEDSIKRSVRQKFSRFEGDLEENVRARPSGSSGSGQLYEVTANAYSSTGVNYAAWHEFANKGHEAPVRGDLKKWAAQKGILDSIGATLKVTPVNQKEGSFMEPAIQKAISKQRRKMRSGRNSVNRDLTKNFRG